MKKGFIVHPFETGNSKYHASYGNHNKTIKSFKTLKEAKGYLKRKGIHTALYDNPSGAKEVKTMVTKRKRSGNKWRKFRLI